MKFLANKGDAANLFIQVRLVAQEPAPAEVKVLGFYDISRAHIHSPARSIIVIKVPRDDDECKSGYAVLDATMYGTKDAAPVIRCCK